MARRIRVSGKRIWANHVPGVGRGWDDPGGGDGDGACPRELSSHAVALREKKDESRKRDKMRQQNQRKIFWYIQWSRDWNWRKMAAATDIQPEKSSERSGEDSEADDENEWIWYWRWLEFKRARRKLNSKEGVPVQFNSMVKWISRLNSDSDDKQRKPPP